MNKIYILEGPDGVGKSTLAVALAEATKSSIIHARYDKELDMVNYHYGIMSVARLLNAIGNSVVLDRWSPSEYIYGNVFRNGPSYDVFKFMAESLYDPNIVWIYCRNDNAVENHLKNKEKRHELYGDMTEIVEGYDEFVKLTPQFKWHTYDFDKERPQPETFIKELLKENL